VTYDARLTCLAAAQALGSCAAGLTVTVGAITANRLIGVDAAGGLAQTAVVLGAGVLSLPVAALAARHGRRVSLAGAYSMASGGAILAAVGALSGWWLTYFLGLVLVGGGTVAGLALRFAAADLAAEAVERPRRIAMVMWAATIGSVVGPNLVGWTSDTGAATPFIVIAALYGCAAAASGAVRIPRSTAPAPPAVSGERRLTSVRRAQRRTRAHAPGTGTASAILLSAVVHMAMIAPMGMAPVHLQHAGEPAGAIGVTMSVHLAAMYAASPLFGVLVVRVGARIAGGMAVAAMAVACAVLAAGVDDMLWFVAGLGLLGLGWSCGMVAASTILAGVPAQHRYRAQGVNDTLLNVGGGLASLVGGVTIALVGYRVLALWIACLLGAVLLSWTLAARGSTTGQTSHTDDSTTDDSTTDVAGT
jgi:MFS family permease